MRLFINYLLNKIPFLHNNAYIIGIFFLVALLIFAGYTIISALTANSGK